MLSNRLLKEFSSLKVKKYRQKYSQFVVEGKKSIQELLGSNFKIEHLLFRGEADVHWAKKFVGANVIEDCARDIDKVSSFETPGDVLAIVKMEEGRLKFDDTLEGLTLFLDEIRDPGNLGTIIRVAAWYGFNRLVLSKGCADFFNPKTIQASMGSFTQIEFCYCEKLEWLEKCKQHNIQLYGTFLDGQSIHDLEVKLPALVVIGNEGNGISSEAESYIHHRITIPGSGKVESLNAAMATGVVLDNFYRLLG